MKQGIHPQLNLKAKATCSTCGFIYEIPSTMDDVKVEACRACHPVYTGEQRKEVTGGRIDRFRKRAEASKGKKK